MRRLASLTIILLGGTAGALAQGGIQWLTDPERAVALAKQTRRPLMFYVVGGTERREGDWATEHRRAFSDPRVQRWAARFVTVKLSRAQHRDLLPKVHFNRDASMELSFVEPNGERLDGLSPSGISNPESLAKKMGLVFGFYRQRLFDRELRPILENREAKAPELRATLQTIREFTIVGADGAVANLLEREGLEARTASLCYEVLADLSTKLSVGKLVERSGGGDAQASKALSQCTPAAAEVMLEQMEGEDGSIRMDIYQAVTKICGVRSQKSAKWWEKSTKLLRDKELAELKKTVTQASQRWQAENEDR